VSTYKEAEMGDTCVMKQGILNTKTVFDEVSQEKMDSEKRTTGAFTKGDIDGHKPLKTFLVVITTIIILNRRTSVTWISKHFF
jgi:hypothetical protein